MFFTGPRPPTSPGTNSSGGASSRPSGSRRARYAQAVGNQLAGLILAHPDLVGRRTRHHAGSLRHDAVARVHSRLLFHTGADHSGLGEHQRHSLALHVGTHQRTVRVVVLQERNHRGRDGEDHTRRNVHQVDSSLLKLRGLIAETSGDVVVHEMPFLVQRLIRLCDDELVFLVRSQIDHVIRDSRVLRVGLVHLAVGGLHEAVLVDAREGSQRVDQADVRAFRSLYRAHSAIMRVMDITDFETGSLTGQAARAQSRQTPLVRQLGQRVVLVHELRQLGASEELLHSRGDRLDVDQGLRRDALHVLRRHSLTHHSLHTGETDAVLVLQQLADRTDTAVAQMVDVVGIADAILQMHVVVDGRKDVLAGDMLRNQAVDVAADRIQELLAFKLLHQLLQKRIVHLFGDAQVSRLHVRDKGAQIDHHVGQDLHDALFRMHIDRRDRSVLDLVGQGLGQDRAGLGDDLAGLPAHRVLRQRQAGDTVAQGQLLVELVAAHFRQIIPSRIEEHAADQGLCTVNRQRLARAQLAVQLEKAVLIVRGRVLLHAGRELRLLAEELRDLRVGAQSERTKKHGDRNLAVAVYAHVENVVGIRLILQPRAPVRDHGAGIEGLA